MARRKSSKKTLAQQVVGLAAVGLPAPARDVVASRWGSRLVLVLVPILLASGVLSIYWVNGVPQVSINKDRAVEVGKEVQQEAFRAAESLRDGVQDRRGRW
ncbi:MAG: hypothetical protein ACKOCN_13750 [Planctomycetaceae bacterium]